MSEFKCLNDELGFLKSQLEDPVQDLTVTTLNLTQIEIKIRKSLHLVVVLQESTYPSISPSQVKLVAPNLSVLKIGRQQVVGEFLKQTNLTINEVVDSNQYKLCIVKVFDKIKEILADVQKDNYFLSETLNLLESGGKVNEQTTKKQPNNSSTKTPKSTLNDEEETAGSSKFKGSDFIFQRIKWDTNIDKDQITIGYLDRFLGVKEIKFNDFKGVHEDKEGVPLHRIRYFKINQTIVWDREQRIDLITGYNEN
jgi:uncharacterized protein (UPF0248 family)